MELTIPVALAVVTTPERFEMAQRLFDNLKPVAQFISLDNQRDYVKNHNVAWEMLWDRFPNHWLGVVQDDVILAEDFFLKLMAVLGRTYPHMDVVSLYSNYKADLVAYEKGEPFKKRQGRQFLNEQFLLMRSAMVGKYLDFFRFLNLDLLKKQKNYDHDVILRKFFVSQNVNVYDVIPNLVDHDISVKSALGHPRAPGGIERKSRTFKYA